MAETNKKDIIRTFRSQVYRYFKRKGRILPWRTDYHPYHILVSEIMLQQTQVDRVIDKFTLFIKTFPTLRSLSDAPLDDVLRSWQGLGYNRRAVSLRNAAIMAVRDFNGIIPDNPDELKTLPGIGPATAASIAAFAYNRPTVFLETNIRTVYIHHFFSEKQSVRDEEILPIAEAALDRRNPRKWYSALMDYGTMLKKNYGNLSRRSVTYKKQSPFAGSNRQLRGQILKTLVSGKKYSVDVLSRRLDRDAEAVRLQLAALINDGMIIRSGRTYRIAQ